MNPIDAEMLETIKRLRSALKVTLMRDTRDPNHNFETCDQIGCMIAKALLRDTEKYEKLKLFTKESKWLV